MASESQEEKKQEGEEGAADATVDAVEEKGLKVTDEEFKAEKGEVKEEEAVGKKEKSEVYEKVGEKEAEEEEEQEEEGNVEEKGEEAGGEAEEKEGEEEKREVENEEEREGSKGVKKDTKKGPEKEGGDSEDKNVKKSFSSSKEAITPNERPTRERKMVERYSAPSPVSRSSASKPLAIVKGSGTPLKDIPNVAFKLSKRKPDDNLQLLHTILFGKKAKAHNLKRDIGKFSGFVWIDNECNADHGKGETKEEGREEDLVKEKQRAKVKEKLDKCVKEKLLDFCDVLNITVNRAVVKKEDLSVKLLEFLASPHATTDVLLAEKEQKGKKRKSKATPGKSTNSREVSAQKSSKKTQVGVKRKQLSGVEDENETEDRDHHSDHKEDSVEGDDNDKAHKEESEQEEKNLEQEKDEADEQMAIPKGLSKKEKHGAKDVKKSVGTKKSSSEKPTKSAVKSSKTAASSSGNAAAKSSASHSLEKRSSRKKQKFEKETQKDKLTHVEDSSKKHAVKSPAKPSSKGEGKGKASRRAKSQPSREELHAVVVNILKEVDFNTATLSDILRQLGTHFGLDLMERKAEVKEIITEVINNMSDEDEDDEDDEDDDKGNDENKD
ncbi:hypothetical protein Ancab_039168 [Ancistrocladus abbreviatus]